MQTTLMLLTLLAALAGAHDARSGQMHTLVTTADGAACALQPASHDADIDILGFVAEVTVRETYTIDERSAGRLLVAFAGSELCELLNCTLVVNDTPQTSDTARDSVGLTVVAGPVVEPGGTLTLSLRYAQLLPRCHGTYELAYRVPLLDTDSEATHDSGPALTPWVAATLTGGMPIRDLTTPSHEAEIWYEGSRQARIVPSLDSRGGETFVLQYSIVGEEILDDFFELETPEGEIIYMVVEPGGEDHPGW
jgi:hypothetical protein